MVCATSNSSSTHVDFATRLARRDFLRLAGAAAAATAATAAFAGRSAADGVDPTPTSIGTFDLGDDIAYTTTTSTLPPGPNLTKIPPPSGAIKQLPGQGNLLAWTVDDGGSTQCIRKYIEFAATSGTRLTFFVIGRYRSWREVVGDLEPLAASGQIQLANHTFSHTPLTRQSDNKIIEDLQRNHDFILDTYGVDCRTFYRPPGGNRSARTDQVAASIGYTVPVMWNGLLEGAGWTKPKTIVKNARKSFKSQAIVLGHLNHSPVTEVFPDLQSIIATRALQTVTLNDVFLV